MYYGSDYFETCFNCAVQLIKDGKAYVDDLTQEEMRQYRGSLTEPGKPSPYRDRSVEENLQLFQDCLLYTSSGFIARIPFGLDITPHTSHSLI